MKTIAKYFRQRKAIAELSRMSDRALRDIGVDRMNIRQIIKSGK